MALPDLGDVLGSIPGPQQPLFSQLGRGTATGQAVRKKRKQKVKASELYVMAGGKQSDAVFMGEVAVGESHCNNKATSWTGCCHCVWQIHEVHAQNLGYKNGAEMKKALKDDPMKCAKAAVHVMNSQGRGAWEGTKYVGTGKDCTVTIKGDSLLDSAAGAVGDPVGTAGDAVDSIGDALTAVLKPLGDFFKIITDPGTWSRVGKVVLGAILLLLAIVMLTKGGPVGRKLRRA